jgi:orotate phosphoribosyltransferase
MKIKNYSDRQKNVRDIFSINPHTKKINSDYSNNTQPYKKSFFSLFLEYFGVGVNKKFPELGILKDKTVLLIDDVATTGSTLFEAGRILKSAGAKKVFGVVIARQEIHPVK